MRVVVKELTRATLPGLRYYSRCTDCNEAAKRADDLAFLTGWWTRHVQETGHRVVIEEEE